MNEVDMKARSALLTALALSAGACQAALGLDDYAFEAAPPEMESPALLEQDGGGGAPSSTASSGGGPSAGSGGDGTEEPGKAPGAGGQLTDGMGGGASMSGAGGAAAAGGMTGGAGTEGAGGQGGASNPPAVCTGCVELVVPVDGGGRTPFQFQLAEPADFSEGIVQWRIYSLEPNPSFFVKAAVQNGLANNFSGLFHQPGIPLDRVGWTNIELDVAASDSTTAPPGTELYTAGGAGIYDKSQIVLIGIEVGALDSFVGTGAVRLLVDEVIISNVPGVASKTFAADPEGLFADVSEGLPGSELIHHAEFIP